MVKLAMPESKPNAQRAGGSYLKPGKLKRPVTVAIDNRPAAEGNTHNGPAMGQYGIDIPVHVAGVPMVLTINTKSDDYAALVLALGDDSADWIGAQIRIADDADVARLHVELVVMPEGAAKPTEPAKKK